MKTKQILILFVSSLFFILNSHAQTLDGVYTLTSVATGKSLDGDAGRLYPSVPNGGDYQKWTIKFNSLGKQKGYTLISVATGKALDGDAGRLYPSNPNVGEFQKWRIEPTNTPDSYTLVSLATGKALDGDANRLYPSAPNGGDYQKWRITKVNSRIGGLGGASQRLPIDIKMKDVYISKILKGGVNATIVRKKDAEANKMGGYQGAQIKDTPSKTSPEKVNGDRVCRTEYRNLAAENLNQDVINADAIGNLRLGNVYDIEELGKGNFNPILLNRAPMRLSMSNQVESELVQQPDNENLRRGLAVLMSRSFPVPPSGIGQYLEKRTTNSEQALEMAASVSYSGGGFNASASFNYNKSNKKNKYIVNYTNAIYQAKAEPANGSFFTDIEQNKNNNLVYIDKITYGVRLLVFLETDLSEEEIKAAFSAGGYGIKADGKIGTKSKWETTTFRIYLFGNSTPLQVDSYGFENLDKEINRLLKSVAVGNKTHPQQLGQPISYSLRFLNGDIAATSLKAENIPTEYCRPNENVNMNLNISATCEHGGYGVYGWADVELLDENGISQGVKTILEVSDRAKIGSGECGSAFQPITFPNVSKATRDNGTLRVWGWINSDGGHFMHAISCRQQNYATGINGHRGNQYYMDIPLQKFMSCMNLNDKDASGAIKPECEAVMHFRETEHKTATNFKIKLRPRFQ